MADKNNHSKKGWVWVLLSIVCPVMLVATMFFPTTIQSSIETELASMSTLMGKRETVDFYNDVVDMSDALLVQTGVVDWLRVVLLPSDYRSGEYIREDTLFNTDFWKKVDGAIYGFMLNVDLALLRIMTMKLWLIAIAVVTIASVVSGFLIREIKKQGFEYSSPMFHGIGRRMVYSLPVVMFVYFVLPFALPVYVVPFITILYSVSVLMIVSNTIKRV